jgi:hypothetical protein
MKRVLIFTVVAFVQFGVASAQTAQTLQLTVDEAVRRAIDHNPDLASVRDSAQVEAARVSESESAYAPVFSTIIGTSSNVTPPSNFLFGERGVDTNDLFTSTGIRQRMRWARAPGACRGTRRGRRPTVR